jgi:6-phosphogluconate dehydrogenase
MARRLADFGIVGLGRMGGGLALQAIGKGLSVAAFSKEGVSRPYLRKGVLPARSLRALAGLLRPPRIVLLYVPAGRAVDSILGALAKALAAGDVIVDGGNSYWGDALERARRLAARRIGFVDAGTSGGIRGAREGACFMVGGPRRAVGVVEPLLRRLAVPDGFVHAGGHGAGHFVKLVHNGIEFGMLQAIGEGVALLDRFPRRLPIQEILDCWRHGSVIRSWLIDLMAEQHRLHGLDRVPSIVEDTGEVNWLVEDAMLLDVSVPVIAQSVMQLVSSRVGPGVAARAVAMMRHGFGDHPFGRSPAIARERRESRIGGFRTAMPGTER